MKELIKRPFLFLAGKKKKRGAWRIWNNGRKIFPCYHFWKETALTREVVSFSSETGTL